MIIAFQMKTWTRLVIWLVLGLLYVVAGFVTFKNPLLAATVLTLILGIALVASGIVRIAFAFGARDGAPWLWIAACRALSPFCWVS